MKKRTLRANATNLESLFVAHYVSQIGKKNATKAAIQAGYALKSAAVQAVRVMKRPHIKARLEKALKEQEAVAFIKAFEVIQGMAEIATLDPVEIFNEAGGVKDWKDIPPEVRRCISGIDVDELFQDQGQGREQVGVTKKIRFWDKNKAQHDLAEHFKLLTRKVEATGRDGQPLNPASPIIPLIDWSKFTTEQIVQLWEYVKSLHAGK